MFEIDEQTGYTYYSFNALFMMLNIMHHKYGDKVDQIPWDYILFMVEGAHDLPQA
tara:strand:- start:442 stop:606 length:165 start_codon:yes stop_codon:yes gene_type:complete